MRWRGKVRTDLEHGQNQGGLREEGNRNRNLFFYYFLIAKIETRKQSKTQTKQELKIDKTKTFIFLNHEITKDRTKMDNDNKSDGDTIPGHLPQASHKPRGVPIPVYSSLILW